MKWESRSVGSMENNAYLLTSSDDHLVLVDAATEPGTLLGWIGPRTLDAVITTHQHFDHIGALAAVIEATGATPGCGGPDAASIAEQTGVQCRTVWTGDTLLFGDEALEVIGLVGHTPGSIALVLPTNPTVLVTGDSLFPGGVGRTKGHAEFDSLFSDVTTKLFDRFGDDTLVLPGHGKSTTLGAERPHLPEWRARGW